MTARAALSGPCTKLRVFVPAEGSRTCAGDPARPQGGSAYLRATRTLPTTSLPPCREEGPCSERGGWHVSSLRPAGPAARPAARLPRSLRLRTGVPGLGHLAASASAQGRLGGDGSRASAGRPKGPRLGVTQSPTPAPIPRKKCHRCS